MHWTWRCAACSVALMLIPGGAYAQDALTVAPTVFTKVLENERTRVLEATFKPGAKVGLHSHPEHLLYMLSEGTLVFKQPGKTPYEMMFNAGQAMWVGAQTRAAENDGDKAVRALIVELKQPVRTVSKPVRGARRAAKGQRRTVIIKRRR